MEEKTDKQKSKETNEQNTNMTQTRSLHNTRIHQRKQNKAVRFKTLTLKQEKNTG